MRGGVCARHGAMRKDVQIIMSSMEECALGTEQRRSKAVSMNLQIKLSYQECAEGTGHVAILMTHLLHICSIMKIKEHPS